LFLVTKSSQRRKSPNASGSANGGGHSEITPQYPGEATATRGPLAVIFSAALGSDQHGDAPSAGVGSLPVLVLTILPAQSPCARRKRRVPSESSSSWVPRTDPRRSGNFRRRAACPLPSSW